MTNFPDAMYARETIWIPFVINALGADENTILIGHSSGAVCCMRILEKYLGFCGLSNYLRHKVKGVVLVSAYTSHLGSSVEKKSGYFDREWVCLRDFPQF